MVERRSFGAFAFLTMAFVVVGLAGVFASFAAPLPLHRAMAREATLDAALATLNNPDPQAALKALAPRLGDSAAALAGGDAASLPARIQAERIAMRARFEAEAAALAFRVRLMIGLLTLSAAAFGVIIAGARRAS